MKIRRDRKILLYIAGIALAVFLVSKLPIQLLRASNTMLNASALLGQFPVTTINSANVDYTTNSADNGTSPTVGAIGFNTVGSTAYDVARNYLFVSDSGNNRVLVYNLNDTDIDYYTADYVLGQSDFISHATGTSQYGLSGPLGLAYDSVSQRLFVADFSNTRVMVYDVRPAGSADQTSCGITTSGIANGMTASCAIGTTDLNSSAISTTAGTLLGPEGLAYDNATGNLYVSQVQANRVTVFHAGISELTANGPDAFHVYGQLDFDGFLNGWDDVTYGAGVPSARTLYSPRGLAFDGTTGLLYVADDDDGRVVVFDTSNVETTTAGDNALYALGKPDLTSFNWLDPLNAGGPYDETPRQNSSFSPVGVTLDITHQLLYVSDVDYSRVLAYDIRPNGSAPQVVCGATSTGIATGMNASCVYGQPDFTTVGSGADAKKMSYPYHLTYISGTDNVVVADSHNNRLLVFHTATPANYASSVDVFGQLSLATSYAYNEFSPDFTTSAINSGAPVISEYGLRSPAGVALDTENHRLFVADKDNNRVLVFNLEADNTITNFGADFVLGQSDFTSRVVATTATGLTSPKGLIYWHAPSGTQYLFVADDGNNRVLAYDVESITNGEAAVAVIGQTNFTTGTSAGTTQNSLTNPTDVTVDTVSNRLIVADTKSTRVTVYDIGTLTTTNMPAMAVIGQANYTANTTGTTATTFNEPESLLYATDSRLLYITDPRNSRVLVYDTTQITNDTFSLPATAVLGQTLFTTSNNVISQSGLSDPSGLAYDAENNFLFVVDGSGNRLTTYDVSTITNGENAVAVIGQMNFAGSSSGTSATLLHGPTRAIFDPSNTFLYIADTTNNRVLQYDFVALTTTSITGTGITGTSYTNTLTTTGSLGTVSFELVSGTMPPGLTFDATGIIGTPTVAGTYNFIVRAVDTIADAGGFRSNQQSYSVVVSAPAGGGGGGTGLPPCDDVQANNFGQSPPCTYDAPILTILSPAPGGTVTLTGNSVVVSGTASDRGTITTVLYSYRGAPALSASGTLSWTTPPLILSPGSNTLVVTAYNNHGIQTSKTLTINYTPTEVVETCATNPNLPGCTTVIVPPPTLCMEPAATNYNQAGVCVYPQPSDICTNISGIQTSVPYGHTETLGICTPIPIIENPGGGGGIATLPQTGGVSSGPGQTVSIIGLIAGILALLSSLFAGAITLSELAFVPQRIWQLILGALGFNKKVRHWGVVFDAVTKLPLDPAYVLLYDQNGKEVATAITDLEGRYGFMVQPGMYRIVANKTNYVFPSRKLSGTRFDNIYADLYFGDYFEVHEEGEVITKNIPLDPLHFDWNEYAKREKGLAKKHADFAHMKALVLNIIFYIGFAASMYVLTVEQSPLTIGTLALYVALFIFRQFIVAKPAYGAVLATGKPVPFGVVKFYTTGLKTLISKKVLDKYGRYYALAPKGTYFATVEQKNDDESYSMIHTSDSFEAAKGVINKKIKFKQ